MCCAGRQMFADRAQNAFARRHISFKLTHGLFPGLIAASLTKTSRHCLRNVVGANGRKSRALVQPPSGGASHERNVPTLPIFLLCIINRCNNRPALAFHSYSRGLLITAPKSLKASFSILLRFIMSPGTASD